MFCFRRSKGPLRALKASATAFQFRPGAGISRGYQRGRELEPVSLLSRDGDGQCPCDSVPFPKGGGTATYLSRGWPPGMRTQTRTQQPHFPWRHLN